jgi:CelD/BcsL family acetyltransferase involved in cellulose biosynthesis
MDVVTTDETESLRQQYSQLSRKLAQAKREKRDLEALKAEHKRVFDRLQLLAPRKPKKLAKQPEVALHGETITDPAELFDLRESWDEMLENIQNYSPFLTWEWWWPWFECFGAEYGGQVVVARDDAGKLHGGLPLATHPGGHMFLMGSQVGPDPAYMVAPAGSKAALMAELTVLRGNGRRIVWEQCPVDERLADVMAAAGAEDWTSLLQIKRHYVHGDLPTTWEAYIEGVPSKNRRNSLRRQFERLEREWGSPECAVLKKATPEALEIIDEMAQHNIKRREARCSKSRWLNGDFCRFLNAAVSLFAERGWMRLHTIHIEGKLAAAMLGWAYRGTFFAYQIGESDEHPELGLGHCIISNAIKASIEEGLERFEMLGQASDFKRTYFPGLTPVATLTIGPDNSKYWFALSRGSLRQAVRSRLGEVRHGG